MTNEVVRVKTERTPNPNTLKYNFSKILTTGVSAHFSNKDDADEQSVLASRIFEIYGVEEILIGRSFISITKQENVSWEEVNEELAPCLERFFESGLPALNVKEQEVEESLKDLTPEDKETVLKIEEVLDQKVRPGLAQDGGDIKLVGFNSELKTVYVKMQGACYGCPSAAITLKQGVERVLIHELGNDKIEKVVQV